MAELDVDDFTVIESEFQFQVSILTEAQLRVPVVEENIRFKMRAVDSGRVAPGYIYWISENRDFDANDIGSAVPPLLGTASDIIVISSWKVFG